MPDVTHLTRARAQTRKNFFAFTQHSDWRFATVIKRAFALN
jgi:hypothetical protein